MLTTKARFAMFGVLLVALGCADDPSVCDQYKKALLDRFACDPVATATLPVNGTYDAFTCVPNDPSDASAQLGIEGCTAYLSDLNQDGCSVPLGERGRCTSGFLTRR